MSAARDERDLQEFLSNVDEIANLIQGLSSTDTAVQEKAIIDAEKKISTAALKDENKSRVDRTLINTRNSGCPNQEEMMSPESFMSALEKDAAERAKARKENEALANALKEKGNDAFSRGDYAGAVKKYTEGLKKRKDMQVLYTNRAQAYIKLQEYEKAISDCDWALRCDENCVKAFFHMGKAYLALKQFSKARACYQKILATDPRKEKLCKDCIDEIDLEEKRQLEEERALEELHSGEAAAVSVSELLQKLSKPDENVLYYTGGIQLLMDLMQDCTGQTLFRTSNGFSVISDNEVVRRVFSSEDKSPAGVELSLALLRLWQAVCKENVENQRLLVTHPAVNVQLPALLTSEVPEIQEECLALLALYAQAEHGRSLLVRHLNLTKWLQTFMSFVRLFDRRASRAVNLLTDLVLEEKFKVQCRIKLSTETLPLFTQLLGSVRTVNQPALAQCIAVMGDLCSDGVVQMQLVESQECWQACLGLVDECWLVNKSPRSTECLHSVLGLMMNLSVEPSLILQELAEEITRKCLSLFSSKDGRIVTRAIGLLSHALRASPTAVEEAVSQGVVKTMITFLKVVCEGVAASADYPVKTLALCVKSSRRAQEQIVKVDGKCYTLLRLLRSENETVAGNAAYCLGRCLEVPGTATKLLDTEVVKILLKLAVREVQKASVQENAAIALGKLCTADARHVSRLRELNGMAVLNDTVKHLQIH
ncbi:hypothetical protein lerEdw1_007624 [Lerista edwardsae]|nr:hypothetical protein lerEdw1_007624 [Lerista edwardsae]